MRKNLLEWTVFAVSLVLIAVVAVLLVRSHPGAPATPRFVVSATPASGGAVEVSVRNAGTAAAADVDVDVQRGSTTSRLTFDFLPRAATRTGTVVFPDSVPGPAVARVVGFVDP